MKHLLLTTIAAVVLMGCGESQPPEPPTAKAPDISIHKAAEAGNIKAVKHHLAASTDVDAGDENASTPLHYAVAFSHKETAELLIAKGADVNTKNELGETPLDWILWCMQSKIADLLRKHGGKTAEELKAERK
jgi:ankyrin repeat protein